MLTPSEQSRYVRQMQMPEVGIEGQQKIKQASVLIIGVGGLGSPAALYLASAGVGKIGLIDDDVIDISNLQRQVIYSSEQQGLSKSETAAARLQKMNPEIQVQAFDERLTTANAFKLFSQYEYILDGADNFATRFLVNDAAYFANKTLITASVLGFEGQLSVFKRGDGGCYRCLYPEPPPAGSVPSCAEAGVLGVMPGMLGIMQANEVLKLILGVGEKPFNKLVMVSGLNMQVTHLETPQNPDCALCGKHPKILDLKEENFICAMDLDVLQMSAKDFANWQQTKKFQLLDVREALEFNEGKLEYTHHIPLGSLEKNYQALALETPVIVYCHSGSRSQRACEFLKSKGYNAINLAGGIKTFLKV